MFLIGPPGPLQRHIAMSFCELTGQEMEYVSLSRDTTETDLKQRREIIGGTVHYIDQVRQEMKSYMRSSVGYEVHVSHICNVCVCVVDRLPTWMV